MKVLYILSKYSVGDGVSDAVNSIISVIKPECYFVLSKWLLSKDSNYHVYEYKDNLFEKVVLNNKFDYIHYFKGINSNILNLVVRKLNELNLHIPIITTVCQSPSYNYLLLSPFELRHSSQFVFIDKTSFHDSIIEFIPNELKMQIYVCTERWRNYFENVEYTLNESNKIIFGRATTLSKCPRDMFDVFDNIDCPNKEFHIVGVPLEGNWVADEAKKRENVKMYGFLPYKEWIEVCKTFDIFLYQLPQLCHASIDANLGLAMAMNIPVVYFGCEAPKERFDHGINGYVAESKEQIVEYANLLSKDFELRKRIGKAGRESIRVKIGTPQLMKDKYELAYKRCLLNKDFKLYIPNSYKWLYLKRAWKRIIREITGIYNRP